MGAERLFWSPSKNGSWLNKTDTIMRDHNGNTRQVNVQTLDEDNRVTVMTFRPVKGEVFIHVSYDVPVAWADTDES